MICRSKIADSMKMHTSNFFVQTKKINLNIILVNVLGSGSFSGIKMRYAHNILQSHESIDRNEKKGWLTTWGFFLRRLLAFFNFGEICHWRWLYDEKAKPKWTLLKWQCNVLQRSENTLELSGTTIKLRITETINSQIDKHEMYT